LQLFDQPARLQLYGNEVCRIGEPVRRAIETGGRSPQKAGRSGRAFLSSLSANRRNKPLVLVHGQSRKPEVIVGVFRPYDEQNGAALIAPVFDKENSAGYQRQGLSSRRDDRSLTSVWLRRILDDVERLTDIPTERFHLYGHSGGARPWAGPARSFASPGRCRNDGEA